MERRNRFTVGEIARTLREQNRDDNISSDVLGSYTGMGEYDDYPVQDADDL